MAQLLLAVLVVAAMVAVPVVMVWSMIDHFRTPPSKRRGGGAASSAVGAALVELDRLVARPSVEHVIEAEQTQPRRDDQDED